ncbi:MAG: hypothetical protein MUE97_02880, partial [Phycisphaerales bacterium]|nr:hypothetical protein [Phycisphaerales bacterium]
MDFIASTSSPLVLGLVGSSQKMFRGVRVLDLGPMSDEAGSTNETARTLEAGGRATAMLFPSCDNDVFRISLRRGFTTAIKASVVSNSQVLDVAQFGPFRFPIRASISGGPGVQLLTNSVSVGVRDVAALSVRQTGTPLPPGTVPFATISVAPESGRITRTGEPYVISSFRLGRVADVAGVNQVQGPDGRLTVDDWIVCINASFAGDRFI